MQITIPGKPIPKKGVKRGRGLTKNGKAVIFNPSSKEMDAVKWIVKSQVRHEPLSKAIGLEITYFMPIPKSRAKDGVVDGDYHIIRPDIDNLTKFICDCMSDIVFADDCQVAISTMRKIYSDNPRTEIYYYEL